jgi:hypothetical protein
METPVNTRTLIVGNIVAVALLSAAVLTILVTGASADMYHRPYHHPFHRVSHHEVRPVSHYVERHDMEHMH